MKRINVHVGFLAFLIIAAVLFYSLALAGITRIERVMYPIVVLIFLLLFTVIDLLRVLIKDSRAESAKEILINNETLKKIAYMSAAIIGYILVMNSIGFFVTSFAFMIFMFKLLKVEENVKMVLISIGTLLVVYIIFILALGLKFPKGLLF